MLYCEGLPDLTDWEQYLCDNFSVKQMDNRVTEFADSIAEMAKEFVCPVTKEPVTDTEKGLVIMLTSFGSMCILKLLENLMEIQEEQLRMVEEE